MSGYQRKKGIKKELKKEGKKERKKERKTKNKNKETAVMLPDLYLNWTVTQVVIKLLHLYGIIGFIAVSTKAYQIYINIELQISSILMFFTHLCPRVLVCLSQYVFRSTFCIHFSVPQQLLHTQPVQSFSGAPPPPPILNTIGSYFGHEIGGRSGSRK
jgi:hypothetical protein